MTSLRKLMGDNYADEQIVYWNSRITVWKASALDWKERAREAKSNGMPALHAANMKEMRVSYMRANWAREKALRYMA